MKNTLLIGLLMHEVSLFFLKKVHNYIENREIQLSLSLHGVKPWFYPEQITIRD